MEAKRTGEMTPIVTHLGDFEQRLQGMTARREQERRRLIDEGHRRWGWPLDASCSNCGDTGKWPNSIHYCGCPAGAALRQQDRDEEEQRWWERRWQDVEIPRRFQRYRLDNAPDPPAADQVRHWISGTPWETGRNLLLTGPVGTGKTGLAVGALWAMHEAKVGPTPFFASVPFLLDQLRPGGDDPGVMEHCQRVGILVLDDLGAEKPSEWVRERLYVLVNVRYEDQLPTIVTSNSGLTDLAASLGERTVSRFAEDVIVVPVDGPDQRRV